MNMLKIDRFSKAKSEMNRPKIIWDLLTKNFGLDFFNEVIEKEYGVTPKALNEFKTQIVHHF